MDDDEVRLLRSGPGRKVLPPMDDVMHDLQHHGPFLAFQIHKTLEAHHLRAAQREQRVEPPRQRGPWHRPIMGQQNGNDGRVMVGVAVMVIVMRVVRIVAVQSGGDALGRHGSGGREAEDDAVLHLAVQHRHDGSGRVPVGHGRAYRLRLGRSGKVRLGQEHDVGEPDLAAHLVSLP